MHRSHRNGRTPVNQWYGTPLLGRRPKPLWGLRTAVHP